jgi:hypothetical protein
LNVLTAISLVVSPSTLLQRSFFDDDNSAGESAINPTLFHLNCLSNYLYAILPNNLSLQGRHHRHDYIHLGFWRKLLLAALPTAVRLVVAGAVDLVFGHHRL